MGGKERFEILRLIMENEFKSRQELESAVERMAISEGVGIEDVKSVLRSLSKEGVLGPDFSIEEDNFDESELNKLAFVLWARHRRRNWRELMSKNCAKIYQEALRADSISLQDLIDSTGFSQPTVSKYVKYLRKNGLLNEIKGRPLVVEPQINDVSIMYANAYDLDLESLEKSVPKLDASSGVERIEDEIAKIHIFSSARTEGNTASRDDVERVLQDLSLHDITATETLEIKDLEDAIELLRSIRNEEFTTSRLVQINVALLEGTEEDAGIIVGGNEISGTKYTPPENRWTVRLSLKALCNFLNERMGGMKDEVLAGIAHFMFVSIHPFVDGNGRTGRLLHSWVLMKAGKPMFIYDPRLHDKYKKKLEEANLGDVTDFLKFSVKEHQNQLDRLEGESREPIFEVDKKTKKEVEKSRSERESSLSEFG